MKLTNKYRIVNISTLFFVISIMACSSGSSGGSSSSTVTGTVTAPGGGIAFNAPNKFERFASSIFASSAYATITGVTAVGAGVAVELIEVDANGAKVGATIATATTDINGAYSLSTSKSANSKYVIRATGTTEILDVRYTGSTNDIDPVTDSVSDLVTSTVTDLTKMSTSEITEIKSAVDGIIKNIDPTGLSAANLAAAITTESNNNEELSNQISSTVQTESICGNVKDASSNNLENIKIVVRDFGNWVTRAKTKTDSSGNYCVNVPAGNYILGALNFTNTSFAASEWWHTSGTKYTQFDAEKIIVAAAASVTKDFALEAGARISGTIKAAAGGNLATGSALEGVKLKIRQYQNFIPVAASRSKPDGTYRLNIIPGTYQVGADNQTLLAYASEYYNTSTGTSAFNEATPVTLTVGNTTTIDFDLEKGYKLSGTILDNNAGNPVTGMRVRVNKASGGGGPAQRLRSNKQGKYRIWLKPNSYNIESYGQTAGTLNMTASNATYNPVGPVTTISTNIKYNGNGVSQAKAWLLTNANATISQELSSSDGSIQFYCKVCATDYKVYVKIDDSQAWGSTVYSGKREYITAPTLVDATQNTMPDIDLLAGGTLSIVLTSDGTNGVANFKTRIMTDASGGNYILKTQRTLGNGTYLLSLPAGAYRVRMIDDGGSTYNCAINITAGFTTNLTYRTDSHTCG